MPSIDSKPLLRRFVEEDTVLRAYVLASTGSPHDAQDILQTVWLVLWAKADEYDEHRSLRAWALGIARLEVLKWRQRLARRRETLTATAVELLERTAVDVGDEIDARLANLAACLEESPAPWRRVLSQKYYDGLSIQSIADGMSRSVASVEMMLVRARRALRACMEKKARALPSGG